MNLEYDDEELVVLHAAGGAFRKVAPIPQSGTTERPDFWKDLVDAGWSTLGSEISDGTLPLWLAVDVFRRGGWQLLTEDLITSSYLLMRIGAGIEDADARNAAMIRLRERRGVLIGDSRTTFLPVLAEDEAGVGLCFGALGDVDVYRMVRRSQRLVLQRWNGRWEASTDRVETVSRSLHVICFDVGSGSWLDAPLGWDDHDFATVEREAGLLHSSALVGCSEHLVDLTCRYAIDRIQFGVQIGSFQAVKHLLADVHAALVVAWNAILSAAADGATQTTAPLVARLLALDAALATARVSAQVHGGIGFTAESNVHLFLKAILDGSIRGGSADDVALRLGRRFMETERC